MGTSTDKHRAARREVQARQTQDGSFEIIVDESPADVDEAGSTTTSRFALAEAPGTSDTSRKGHKLLPIGIIVSLCLLSAAAIAMFGGFGSDAPTLEEPTEVPGFRPYGGTTAQVAPATKPQQDFPAHRAPEVKQAKPQELREDPRRWPVDEPEVEEFADRRKPPVREFKEANDARQPDISAIRDSVNRLPTHDLQSAGNTGMIQEVRGIRPERIEAMRDPNFRPTSFPSSDDPPDEEITVMDDAYEEDYEDEGELYDDEEEYLEEDEYYD